jgi:ferric-dicitrate binding protein FerR (iron transport regulator)
LILVAFGGLSYYITYSGVGGSASVEQPVMAMKHLETERGERAGVTFSDGTKIILNADSKLEFPKEFEANRREVYLDGEAYFEVAENKDRPFVIKTNRARVKVLGTELNVQAWNGDKRVGVGVRKGRVSVVSSDTASREEPVILEKFQRAVLEEGDTEFAVHNLEKEKFLYWLKDGLYFQNTPLPHVIKRLERRFNIEIQIGDPEVSNYKYTGALSEAQLEETLKVISVSLDIEFKRKEDHILVRSKQ